MDQWVAVFTTISPVTQTAEADVNKASNMPMLFPSADAIGRFNRIEPTRMSVIKPRARTLGGFNSNKYNLSFMYDIIVLHYVCRELGL
jgi:hypothetical protein